MDRYQQSPNKGKTLKATSIIEVIVASIIFLTIFTMSLYTITQLTSRNSKVDYTQMIEDVELASHNNKEIGDHTEEYLWGEMRTTVENHNEFQDIIIITIKCKIGIRVITFKFLAQQ